MEEKADKLKEQINCKKKIKEVPKFDILNTVFIKKLKYN